MFYIKLNALEKNNIAFINQIGNVIFKNQVTLTRSVFHKPVDCL